MTCGAIIVAAGSSRRAGFDKLLAQLNNLPVLRHSINAFISCPHITEIVVVCPQDRFDQVWNGTASSSIPVIRVDGGSERHESVINGIRALTTAPQLIAVHDGARPLIHQSQILRCIEAAHQHDASACAHPITDTLKRSDNHLFTTEEPISREHMWAMETPQIFNKQVLCDAYEHVINQNLLVTDEVSALQHIGKATYLVHNPTPNPKITWPLDIELATALSHLKIE